MEIILDELQKNNVLDIDMRTLSHHVNYLLDKAWRHISVNSFTLS